MGFAIGNKVVGGAYIGGKKVAGAYIGGKKAFGPVADTIGNLAVTALRRRGGGATWSFVLSDPDGVRSITSAVTRATDGNTRNANVNAARTDANTWGGSDSARNNRWRRATLTVVYVEERTGESRTIIHNWNI